MMALVRLAPWCVIAVLANNRLRAFDVGGNPVQFFKGQKTPYFLQLDATAGHTYLDLAVEFTGFLYVLSQSNDTSVFYLSIYRPSQTDTRPICQTLNVNAGRIAVDFWRSVYTLDYAVMLLPDTTVPDITEPSVSLWLPSLALIEPKSSLYCARREEKVHEKALIDRRGSVRSARNA